MPPPRSHPAGLDALGLRVDRWNLPPDALFDHFLGRLNLLQDLERYLRRREADPVPGWRYVPVFAPVAGRPFVPGKTNFGFGIQTGMTLVCETRDWISVAFQRVIRPPSNTPPKSSAGPGPASQWCSAALRALNCPAEGIRVVAGYAMATGPPLSYGMDPNWQGI